jgi:hypothetical protein
MIIAADYVLSNYVLSSRVPSCSGNVNVRYGRADQKILPRKRASGAHAKEDLMVTGKSRFGHLTVEAITFLLVLGVLSMIWPAIIAVFLGVILLLQSFTAEPEVVVLSWVEIDHMPVVVDSLRRPDLPAVIS